MHYYPHNFTSSKPFKIPYVWGISVTSTLEGYYKIDFPEGLGRSHQWDMHARV